MKKSVDDYMIAAAEQVQAVSPTEAERLAQSEGFQFVDVRGRHEVLASGKIKDAIHAPRGMLEFLVDPSSPYHDKCFSEDKKYIVYCAKGGRSVLAAHRMKEMGYIQVRSLQGGFNSWREAGLATDAVDEPSD